jgi:predicted RNA-binding Zn-ribbon protein involved in translation (DUF1610 family)
MRKLQVILGVVMVISVFLPWVSAEMLGWETTATGIDHGYGILVLIMGICCAGLSFLPDPKIRIIGQLATGIIALIGVAGYWGTVGRGLEMFQGAVSVSPEFGFILCIIVAIAVTIIGISQLVTRSARKSDVMVGEKANLSCPKCGTLNTSTAKFCTSCGAELHPTQTKGES